MKRSSKVLLLAFRLFLGIIMIKAGAGKLIKHTKLSSQDVIEKVIKIETKDSAKKTLYISGMKQTGFAWEMVALGELFFGLFLFFYRTYFFGSIFLLPVTAHIFLFHLVLEPDEIGELIYCGTLFAINLILIFFENKHWKLLFFKINKPRKLYREFTG